MWHQLVVVCLFSLAHARWYSPTKVDGASVLQVADLCKQCNADGSESDACGSLVQLNLANDGVNVCEPGHGDGMAAPDGEYNEDMFEGDIVQDGTGRASLTSDVSRWDNAVVPYVIENVFSGTDVATIRAAMKHIEENTCVRFRRRGNEQDYIKITNRRGTGCFSSLGKVHRYYQPQTLNLGQGCIYSIGTPVHEMLHALGFIHEQNRPDRDSNVWIDWGNIIQGKESQYKKESSGAVSTSNTKYDYGSVMHYGDRGFARDRSRPVMKPYTQGVTMGQRRGLSRLDAYEVKAAYCR